MSSINDTQIEPDGIGHVLSDKKLKVPAYQRAYSWGADNVDQFLTDITSAFLEGEEEYFLGTIVLIKTPSGRLEIVDGQQRLATASIFIAAIKDYFKGRGEGQRADTVQAKYIFSVDEVTMAREQHLLMNDDDNDFFCSVIDNTYVKVPRVATKSQKCMSRAAQLAHERIRALEKLSSDPGEKLAQLLGYIRDRVQVICVTVSDESNAFAIFETLNDRGLALSVADLLKNYVFGRADTRIEEAKARWAAMTGILMTVGDESLVPVFIRHFWASRYEPTTEKELFKKIKTRIHNKDDVISMLDELVENAKCYAMLLNPDHERWLRLGTPTQEAVRVMADMRFDQTRPLLLAILSHFSDAELTKSLKRFVDWSVRLLVAGNTRSGQFSKHLSSISVSIADGSIRTTKLLAAAMAKIVPGNADFILEFETVAPTRQMARYYLIEIEKKKIVMAGGDLELVPSYSTDVVNLEHVLPQTLSTAKWPNFDDDTARDSYSKLGNLTLLNSVKNSTNGNESFAEKKTIYSASSLIITRELSEYEDWDKQTIRARQKEMARLAAKIWPV